MTMPTQTHGKGSGRTAPAARRLDEAAAENRRLRRRVAALEKAQADGTAQLRAMSEALAVVEERERRALARDLHDGLGQVLAVAKLRLSAIRPEERPPALATLLKEVENLIDAANRSVHSLALQLSPPTPPSLGLVPALVWLAGEMQRAYGLAVHIHDDGRPKRLGGTARTTLFRVVRELLINVAKHARVPVAEVTCRQEEENRLALTVADSGIGFDYQKALAAPAPGIGLGLVGVRERMDLLGGEMHVESEPGRGTTIALTVPLEAPRKGKAHK
ncbi:MAG: sensor histidine kinase [Rhodocyclales bacterium]|nr:sensor histidine kinase [Rhodocyclales bacterium]